MEVSFNKSSVYLPPQAFSSSTDSFVVSIIYRTLNDILLLSKDPDASSDDVITANTSIVSSTVMPEPPNVLTKPINIVLENIKVWRQRSSFTVKFVSLIILGAFREITRIFF